MPAVFNDVAGIIPITAVFPRNVVLDDVLSCIMLG
jgi:hypothetical protein